MVVASGAKFSGRYLKYLTKKFLKKQSVFYFFVGNADVSYGIG